MTRCCSQDRAKLLATGAPALLEAAQRELTTARTTLDPLLRAAVAAASAAGADDLAHAGERDELKALLATIVGNTVAARMWPKPAADGSAAQATLTLVATHASYPVLKFSPF